MRAGDNDYGLFIDFFDAFATSGDLNFQSCDPQIIKLEQVMAKKNQFFYLGDLLQFKVLFVSQLSVKLLGCKPEEFQPYLFFNAVHPEDSERHSLGKAKIFKMCHEVYHVKKGHRLLSTNFRIKNHTGEYANMLMQVLIFYCTKPYESVYILKVHTDISWSKKLKCGYHYYYGEDLSNFRFPDEKLLSLGIPYSRREFEIIRMIASGMHSEQIAEKLFLSPETVYTHRRNILRKSPKANISDLIYDLVDRGVL
jgi:hypothetical protein